MFRTQEEKFLEEVAATAISRLLDWRDYLGLRLSKAWGMLSAKELDAATKQNMAKVPISDEDLLKKTRALVRLIGPRADIETVFFIFRCPEPQAEQALVRANEIDVIGLCKIPNPHHPTVTCNLVRGHEGLHRVDQAPTWDTAYSNRICPYLNQKDEPCVLVVNHWVAHRNKDGYQFTVAEAHLAI